MPVDPAPLPPSQLLQDLYEIDLLLDFISGHPDKNIALLGKTIKTSTGEQIVEMSERDIVTTFYEYRSSITIGTPPTPQQEWFILKLKDILNSFVSPARGLTIAFTILFSIRQHFFPVVPSNRLLIAQNAFPGLIANADLFRKLKTLVASACIVITIAGALLLAQAFYGEQLASRFEAAKLKDTEAASRLYMAIGEKDKAPRAELSEYCSNSVSSATTTAQIRTMCDDYAFKHALLCAAIHDVGAYGSSPLFYWINGILPAHAFGKSSCSVGGCDAASGQQEDAPTLLNMLTLLSNYILPLFFGVSGSLTAFLRGLQEKVRDSVLAPRDSALTLISLPLGIIAGITVGLFYNGAPPSGLTPVPLGTFTLTSAGVAFLAGYGAEAFFLMLDKIISKVFRIDEKAVAAPADGKPPNAGE